MMNGINKDIHLVLKIFKSTKCVTLNLKPDFAYLTRDTIVAELVAGTDLMLPKSSYSIS